MGRLSRKNNKSIRLKSKKSKRQYGGKKLSRIRKKIQRVKISRKRVKRGTR
tara:strand:- start:408 stop:560 length:153 start_codon:yes stop_codon:yes gene_type:complete